MARPTCNFEDPETGEVCGSDDDVQPVFVGFGHEPDRADQPGYAGTIYHANLCRKHREAIGIKGDA